MKRTSKHLVCQACMLCLALNTMGQVESCPLDTMQAYFKMGKIVALKGNIACYRKNGLEGSGSYGYCIYDSN